jgi:hypothetical protein
MPLDKFFVSVDTTNLQNGVAHGGFHQHRDVAPATT